MKKGQGGCTAAAWSWIFETLFDQWCLTVECEHLVVPLMGMGGRDHALVRTVRERARRWSCATALATDGFSVFGFTFDEPVGYFSNFSI